MAEKRTRRQLLRLTGVGTLTGLAGCATLLDSGGPGSGSDDGTTGSGSPGGGASETTTNAGTETTTAPTETTAAETTETTAANGTSTTTGPQPIQSPSGVVSQQSSLSPASNTYAMMGAEDAPVTAVLFGGWKCPFTRSFVQNGMGELVRTFVEPGDVALEFRGVPYEDGEPSHGPDEPRAARAGLAVWNIDPDAYWNFFAYFFENVESRDGWASTETLVRIAEAAGVSDLERLRTAIEEERYEQPIQRTMDRVDEIPIPSVPRIYVDGEQQSPTSAPEETRQLLRNAVENATE